MKPRRVEKKNHQQLWYIKQGEIDVFKQKLSRFIVSRLRIKILRKFFRHVESMCSEGMEGTKPKCIFPASKSK